MKLKFKDILPNPNRDLKANPLDAEKLAELVASINTTGFWDNVVVRKNADGRYELAYGHHRIEAAKQAGLTEADFILKDLDDELMIKIMDNENRETYGTSPLSLMESVRAVVKGLAEGRVKPFEIDPSVRKDAIRYAPSFVPRGDVDSSAVHVAYTALDIATFLGRTLSKGPNRIKPERSIVAALNALHLMELGHLNKADLFKEKLVQAPEGEKATQVKVPLSANELLSVTSQRMVEVVRVQERRGKTAAEYNKLREEQLALQKERQAEDARLEEERKAWVQKEADARREENIKKADKLAKQVRENDTRAKAKEALYKVRMAELDETVARKKAWEAEQRVQDDYLPIRRDVENMMNKLEGMVSESNSMREQVKSLAKRKVYVDVNKLDKDGTNIVERRLVTKITPVDLVRLRTAAMAVSDWFGSWVAPQFAPELQAAQQAVVNKRKLKNPEQIRKGSGA